MSIPGTHDGRRESALGKQFPVKKLCSLAPVLKGSWDLVSRVITKVTILITPIRGLITLLTKSHDPPSRRPASMISNVAPWLHSQFREIDPGPNSSCVGAHIYVHTLRRHSSFEGRQSSG